jgi:uncharacterized UPF0160 family protein
MFSKKIKLITHDSTFHADDAFAHACLQLYYEKLNKKTRLIRTRDMEIIKTGDVVFDVGQTYDPETNRYDHHQTGGAGERGEYNIPYSSFGLIWKHFGRELVSCDEVHQKIDDDFVQQICAVDTATMNFQLRDSDWIATTFDDFIKSFNPNDLNKLEESLRLFNQISQVCKQILIKQIETTEQKHVDTQKVLEIYQNSPDKRVIVLDKFRRWSALKDLPEPLYVIFPGNDGKYRIRAIPVDDTSLDLRLPLPEEWRGKERAELQEITQNKDFLFVHNNGFLGSTNTLESAIDMARRSIEMQS